MTSAKSHWQLQISDFYVSVPVAILVFMLYTKPNVGLSLISLITPSPNYSLKVDFCHSLEWGLGSHWYVQYITVLSERCPLELCTKGVYIE